MKETTALNQISKIVDKIDYKSLYIEITTDNDKYTLEREKHRVMGFGDREKRR